jgi:hypothetical protein
MSLLTIVQEVCGALALVQPVAVVTSTDRQIQQLYNLANEEGRALARRHTWQALTVEQEFTTLDQAFQVGALPADFDRFKANTFFNRTTRRPMTGPITSRQWQWIQAQPVYSTVYLAWRERGNQFLVAPNPAVGNDCYYEYISANWALSASDEPQSSFLADSDTYVLDETLTQLGLRWRFLRAKGLDYSEEFNTYEREVELKMARDGGNSMISLAPQPVDLNRVNLPDGSFGV